MASFAAKKFGANDAAKIYRRTQTAIGVAIWRRAASMVHACMPQLADDALALLSGGDPALPPAAAAAPAGRSFLLQEGLADLAA